MKPHTSSALETADPSKLPRFLAYALPRADNDHESRVKTHEEFTVHDVPLGSSLSFLDYDGIVLFAGAFEHLDNDRWGLPKMICANSADLDLRDRELSSALQHGKPVIFLVRHLVMRIDGREVDSQYDLFRRFARNIKLAWVCQDEPCPLVESYTPEFREYVTRFGTGYVEFFGDTDREGVFKPICGSDEQIFGVAFAGKVFLLPSAVPQSRPQLEQLVMSAISSTIAYRKRMASQMPAWVNEFVFAREGDLRTSLENIQKKALELDGEIGTYTDLKGALCFQSDPLVAVVTNLMGDYLGITLAVDDKCIDDATLRDEQDNILAVFEIKGVKSNFTRNNVNQVDSHRERLGVAANTPGILIMNTLMAATSIKDKDQGPHPDIIKKAAADGVLLIRTLDLLRYANAVEQGILTKEAFRDTILREAGWLKVEEGKAEVVRD